MKNVFNQLFVMVIGVMLWGGCDEVTRIQRMYAGEPKLQEQTIRLHIGSNVRVISVDDSPVLSDTRIVEMLPGRHSILAGYDSGEQPVYSHNASELGLPGDRTVLTSRPRMMSMSPVTLGFEGSPNQEYVVTGLWNGVLDRQETTADGYRRYETGPGTVQISEAQSGTVVISASVRVVMATPDRIPW